MTTVRFEGYVRHAIKPHQECCNMSVRSAAAHLRHNG